jgi:hypothetical protein
MLTPTCPKCRRMVPADDINVSADVALCRPCNLAHKLSGLAHGTGIAPNIDLARPPAGTWQRSSGLGTIIGASQRSVSGAIFTFLFGAFWNGIISIFVALAIASTLALLGVDRPDWLPKPIMNGGAMGAGITIFLWLFLMPFIAIGLALIAGFFLCVGGRTEVRLRANQGEIFTGIGSLGFKKRFDPALVTDVRIEDKRWRDSDGDRHRSTQIILEREQGKPLKFASALQEDRRQFMAAALRSILIK